MNRDYKIDSEEIEMSKENLINEWIQNGANQIDAEQLYEDMINDQFHSDSDQDVHFDITIDERITKYSNIKKHNKS